MNGPVVLILTALIALGLAVLIVWTDLYLDDRRRRREWRDADRYSRARDAVARAQTPNVRLGHRTERENNE